MISVWASWKDRNSLVGAGYPGIYAIALSERNIAGKPFSWRKEIIYIGMTNAPYGLKGRLEHFDATISRKRLNHGGADRVLLKHRKYAKLSPKLYVAVAAFRCDVRSNKPNDLITMGKVAEFEYLCFAQYAKKFGELPEFNNKKASLKFSLEMKGVEFKL